MTRSTLAVALFAALAIAGPAPAQTQDTTVTLRAPDTVHVSAVAITKSEPVPAPSMLVRTGSAVLGGVVNVASFSLRVIGRAGHSAAKTIDAGGCTDLPLSASCKSYIDREIADAQHRNRQRTSTASSTLKGTSGSTPEPHSRK